MAISRRQFIKRTGWLTAGSILGPGFLRSPLVQRALASAMGDRYLVILQADGGNDGLNTVIPTGDVAGTLFRARYEAVRHADSSALQIPTNTLGGMAIANDPISQTPLALHPGLGGFKSLYDLGKLAVIQGCGYPGQNLSHELSRGFWETGDPLNVLPDSSGWMGRYLVASLYGPNDISSVNIRSSIAREFNQSSTNVLAFTKVANFTFPGDPMIGNKQTRQAAYGGLSSAASAASDATLRYLGNGGTAMLTASQKYPAMDLLYRHDRPTWNAGYTALQSSTADDLREVAKVIFAVENQVDPSVCARFFQVRKSGFDTHASQSGTHNTLLQEISNAVEYFYHDLDNMSAVGGGNVSDKVSIVWWSEFSRRIHQNATGTDHGTQGPIFVIGGPVNGGVYGNHPDINSLNNDGNTIYSQAPGDPHRSTDLRDVFGTILKHGLGMPDPAPIFPLDAGDPNKYWTSANFDLGFLT